VHEVNYEKIIVRDTGIADEVERVRGAVVHVYKKKVSQGSGCLLSHDGILFTAKHVTDGEYGEYEVKLDDGRVFPVKYAIEDKENDVSFFMLDLEHARKPGSMWAPTDMPVYKNYVEYIQEPNLPYAKLANYDSLRMGDKVFIMGSPLGINNFNSVSLGIVSGMNRNLYDRYGWEQYRRYTWYVMLQSTSPTLPGNSGGPVFDMKCNVIGVLVAGEAETLNFSVPVARFRDTIDTVRQWFALCRFNVVEEEAAVTPADEWYSQENGHGYPCH
jgi:S1-C subfamily serine protease